MLYPAERERETDCEVMKCVKEIQKKAAARGTRGAIRKRTSANAPASRGFEFFAFSLAHSLPRRVLDRGANRGPHPDARPWG